MPPIIYTLHRLHQSRLTDPDADPRQALIVLAVIASGIALYFVGRRRIHNDNRS